MNNCVLRGQRKEAVQVQDGKASASDALCRILVPVKSSKCASPTVVRTCTTPVSSNRNPRNGAPFRRIYTCRRPARAAGQLITLKTVRVPACSASGQRRWGDSCTALAQRTTEGDVALKTHWEIRPSSRPLAAGLKHGNAFAPKLESRRTWTTKEHLCVRCCAHERAPGAGSRCPPPSGHTCDAAGRSR